MNKLVIGLLVSVCLLGFALILLNEHLGSNISATAPEKTPPVIAADATIQESAPQIVQNDKPADTPILPNAIQDNELQKEKDQVVVEVPVPPTELKVPSAVEQDTAILSPAPSSEVPPVTVQPVDEHKIVVSSPQEKSETKAEKTETKPVVKPETKDKPSEPRQTVTPETKKVETQAKQEKATPVKKAVEPKEKSAPTAGKGSASAVTLFTVLVRENGATVRLRANTALPFSASQLQKPEHIVKQLQNPERLMFDLTGAWDVKDPGVPNNVVVSKVRVGKMADRMRIVVDLKEKPKRMRVKVTEKKDGLDIFIDR